VSDPPGSVRSVARAVEQRRPVVRERLSAAQARRVALAAQGFGRPRPADPTGRARLRGLFDRVGVIQIDSVNAFVRAHYLPGWSRLGAYSRDALDRYVHTDRRAYEYWAHEASYVPVDWQPLLRWRAARARAGEGIWGGLASFARDRGSYVEAVLDRVARDGPLAAAELAEPGGARSGTWWGWSESKRALEFLMWSGQLCVAGRRGNFERLYDRPERVLPAAVLAAPTPTDAVAQRTLLLHAADRLGVATGGDLADYFRMSALLARPRLAELVEAGDLLPVTVDGWRAPAYLRPGQIIPRRVDARALVSPFDSLVWERSRTRRLFGLDLVLEIYTPAAKRRYGYYVLPFLLGDSLVARVDLKSDRKAGVLRVLAAWLEPSAADDPGAAAVSAALWAELAALASWLDLDSVAAAGRGDLPLPG
jgi:uncharacterized protein